MGDSVNVLNRADNSVGVTLQSVCKGGKVTQNRPRAWLCDRGYSVRTATWYQMPLTVLPTGISGKPLAASSQPCGSTSVRVSALRHPGSQTAGDPCGSHHGCSFCCKGTCRGWREKLRSFHGTRGRFGRGSDRENDASNPLCNT